MATEAGMGGPCDGPDAAGLDLVVNGRRQTLAAETLAQAMAQLGFGAAKVATAVNGDFVAIGRRAGFKLSAGDSIEIVAAREGG